MSKTLDLGGGFRVPLDVLTSAIGIIGVRGSGKTTTAGVVVEEAIGAGVPAVITDPTGAWFGLRTSADGKSAGLPVYVFGGEHADVPLEPDSGKVVAQFVVDKRVPVVLDISLMTKGQQIRFVADFHEEVYHKNREPLLVVVDETARFCPQSGRGLMSPDLGRCIGAIDDIAALGRRRGLGVVLIGQRPARINKDVLTQCHTLIAMQITSPQDRKAVNEWVEEQHGNDEHAREFMRSLTTLKVGEGFVWSPTMLGVFKRVNFRNRATFDSSATPKIGQKAITPQVFAKVDLGALTAEIAAAKERAEADDPRRLRARISTLEHQLLLGANVVASPPEIIETEVRVSFVPDQLVEALGEISADLDAIRKRLDDAIEGAIEDAERRTKDDTIIVPRRKELPATPQIDKKVNPSTSRSQPSGSSEIPKAERALLTAIAQSGNGCDRARLSFLSGYSIKSSSFSNAISALRTAGYAGPDWPLRITDAGLKALGPFTPLPTGRALHSYWIGRLEKAPATLLRIIIDTYPGRVGKAELSKLSGYSITSSSFSNALSELRTLQLIEGRGDLRASDALFERTRA